MELFQRQRQKGRKLDVTTLRDLGLRSSGSIVYLGGGNSNIFNFHPENWGRWTQFDEHIFQMGWNHQLDIAL